MKRFDAADALKRKRKRKQPKRERQKPHPPTVTLWAVLPRDVAHQIIDIAASEGWSISRVIAEALMAGFGPATQKRAK